MSARHTRADIAYMAAQEQALATPDVFGDWFGAELFGAQAQIELPAQPVDVASHHDLDSHPVPYLYMLAVDCGQKAHVRIAAMDAIAHQYLRAKEDFVQRLAREWSDAA
jgi:hypothetical protein